MDGDGLLVRREGGAWHPPPITLYDRESDLQRILAAQPDLLPGVGEDAVAVRELPIPGIGWLDVAVVDRAGRLTLCECKLHDNSDMKRRVVGQVLAYAAGLWKTSYEDFDTAWRARHPHGLGLVAALGDNGAGDLPEAVAANLAAGAFQLVLAVDAITDELRAIVEYLNSHTDVGTSIVALELGYAREGEVEILVPRLYGAEQADSKRRARARRSTEEELVAALERIEPTAVEPITRLLSDVRRLGGELYWGTGRAPSVTGVALHPERSQPFSVWAGPEWVGISVNFAWMGRIEGTRQRIVDALSGVPVLAPLLEEVAAAGYARRPTLRWQGQLDQPEVMEAVHRAVLLPFEEGPAQERPAGSDWEGEDLAS